MIEEIVKMLIAALLGGGLWQLITWRLRKRKLQNEVLTNQYKDMESIMDSYLKRMAQMTDKLVKLQQENARLLQLVNEYKVKSNESND